MNNFRKIFIPLPIFLKVVSTVIVFALLACMYAFIFYSVANFFVVLNFSKHDIFYYLSNKTIIVISSAICIAFTILLIRILVAKDKTNFANSEDKRGVHIMEKGTFGTSDWLKEKDIHNHFEINDINNTDTIIYGQLTEDGKKIVGWKPNESGPEGNRNTFMVASMGSGKSFGYVRTELLQSIRRGNSFVVTDPKAELYIDISNHARESGYDVKVLNLSNPEYSDTWDILSEVINEDTKRLDATRLNTFVSIYMQNAGCSKNADFWYQSASNLISATIACVAYLKEEELQTRYINYYAHSLYESKILSGTTIDSIDDDLIIRSNNEFVSFEWLKKEIVNRLLERSISKEKILDDLLKIEEYVDSIHPFTIEKVFEKLLNFKDTESTFNNIPKWHPAYISYKLYITNDSKEVRASALQNAQISFQLLRNKTLQTVLSRSGIKLHSVNKKKTAIFVIMPNGMDNSTRPISSLFFSFLFMDAMKTFDDENQLAAKENRKNKCLPIVAMLDEFYSIGVIGGDPDAFGRIMAISRGYKFYISIINQVYSQLEQLYGKFLKDIIQGGCQTVMFLGGSDTSTKEFISNMAGLSTVLDESHDTSSGLIGGRTNNEYRTSASSRSLLTPDEVGRWMGKVLVMKQGALPLELKPFTWVEHPDFKKCKQVSVYETVQKISELEDTKSSLTINEIIELCKSNSKVKIDSETGEVISDISHMFE